MLDVYGKENNCGCTTVMPCWSTQKTEHNTKCRTEFNYVENNWCFRRICCHRRCYCFLLPYYHFQSNTVHRGMAWRWRCSLLRFRITRKENVTQMKCDGAYPVWRCNLVRYEPLMKNMTRRKTDSL